ncbi:MAG: cation diffusion facilitator family transporter, partial [Gemmatimonadota bacterium]
MSRAAGHTHSSARDPDSRARQQKGLALVLALTAGYMIAEIIGGLLTNSLALLADAGHMFSDVAALGLSLFAMWIARRPATPQRTYGYHRIEILAALANGVTLVAVAIYIFIEAAQRLGEPPEVQGPLMLGVAAGGLVVNVVGLWILHEGRGENLNVHGAWLHVLGDLLGSVGTIIAAILISTTGWNLADPIASVLIGLLILVSSWRLLKEAAAILMEHAPGNLDVEAVQEAMSRVPGVLEVHDLHVWTITSGLVSLSAHVLVAETRPNQVVLEDLRNVLESGFEITHMTVQCESAECPQRG